MIKTLYQPDEHTTCRNLRIKMREWRIEREREKKAIYSVWSVVAADQQKQQQRENRRTFAPTAQVRVVNKTELEQLEWGKRKESFFFGSSRGVAEKAYRSSSISRCWRVPHRVSRFCRRRAFSIGRAGWVSFSVSGDG